MLSDSEAGRIQTTPNGYITSLLESRTLDFSRFQRRAKRPAPGAISPYQRHVLSSAASIGSLHVVVDLTNDGGAQIAAPSVYELVGQVSRVSVHRTPDLSPTIDCSGSEEQENAVRGGLSPSVAALLWIEEATGLPKTRIHRLFGVSRTAVYDWFGGARITEAHRQHLLAVYEVLKRAQRQYKTPERLAAWLDTPTGSEGVTPAKLLEEGKFDRVRVLSMVTPSTGLAPVPHWVRRRPPTAWAAGAESRQQAFPPNDAEASPPGNRGE